MDVRFAYPYFRDDKLWCWLSNTGHWPDTGGSVPGAFLRQQPQLNRRVCVCHL